MSNEQPSLPTPRQLDVLNEIARMTSSGEAVTTTRLSERLGMPRQNVRTYLLALRERDLVIYRANEREHTIVQLTDRGRVLTGTLPPAILTFPILGEVAAGQPTFTGEQIEGYAARLQDILELHEGDFLLRVRGNSMIGVGIYSGDLVAIHPTSDEPHAGEITLVSVPGDDTATLKRWQRNNGTVSLHSENPEYEVMTYKVEDVQVQGCLVGHIGTGRSRRAHSSTGNNGHG